MSWLLQATTELFCNRLCFCDVAIWIVDLVRDDGEGLASYDVGGHLAENAAFVERTGYDLVGARLGVGYCIYA